MVTLLSEGPEIGWRGARAVVDAISTAGSSVAITLGVSGTWGVVSDIPAAILAVDAETSAAASGSVLGVTFLSFMDIFCELGGAYNSSYYRGQCGDRIRAH